VRLAFRHVSYMHSAAWSARQIHTSRNVSDIPENAGRRPAAFPRAAAETFFKKPAHGFRLLK